MEAANDIVYTQNRAKIVYVNSGPIFGWGTRRYPGIDSILKNNDKLIDKFNESCELGEPDFFFLDVYMRRRLNHWRGVEMAIYHVNR